MTKLLKWTIILLIFPITVFAQTYYSIQVSARKNLIDAEIILRNARNYEDARIDKINGFYKVRVGLFDTYKEAKKYLINSGIKKSFPDAFLSKVSEKTLETSIFYPEIDNEQIKTERPEKLKNTKEKDNATYSISIFKTGNKTEATKFYTGLPQSIKREAFLYSENNTYSVRLFQKKGKENISKKLSDIKQFHFETEITPTNKTKIISTQTTQENKTSIKTEEKPKKKTVKPSKKKISSEKIQEKTTVKTDNKGKLLPLLPLIGILIVGITIISFILGKREENTQEAKEMYQVLDEEIKKGNTSLAKEIVVPYLSKFPEDIKAQELYAIVLEKEGRYMEAADIYFTIAEVLEGKQQYEEAIRYKKKAEEIINREFNKKKN